MKTVVIVEDEMLAAKRLQRTLTNQIDYDFEVLAILDSVKSTAKWLANNPCPDLLFMDIQLGDGLSFEVFDIVDVLCPVIFITAFNEYAVEAFKVNSIAYILKPVEENDLRDALDKHKKMVALFNQKELKSQLHQAKKALQEGYKSRFMVKTGSHIKAIPVTDICYFFSREKATQIRTSEGRTYLIDYSLEQLTELLDPKKFFRINRKYIVCLECIQDIIAYSNSRLQLKLPHLEDNDAIVSREKVNDFKYWLDS